MPIVLYQKMPPGTTLEMIQAVTDEMGARNDPPEGLVIHTVIEVGGRITICDVWESGQAYEKFRDGRLGPAFARVFERMGVDPTQMGEPDTEIIETLDVIRGA